MSCPRPEAAPGTGGARPLLAEFFRRHGPAFAERHCLSPAQRRALQDILRCRTAALGGHVFECDRCEHQVPVYNSCLNRNCPQCQAFAQARWIAARTQRLLPVGHHHVVFTLPSELRSLARLQPRQVFAALFEATSQTLEELARDELGGRLGITAVLHTWTRELTWHPHLHCVVTAGALSLDGKRWIDQSSRLFDVNTVKATFRTKLLASLQRRIHTGDIVLAPHDAADIDPWQQLCDSLPSWRKWVVYIEPPFGRSTHVIEYLGRYTHRIGISNARVVDADDHGITFRTRGDDTTTLAPDTFLHRFLQHVLPPGFHKIRHYGLYAAAHACRLWPIAAAILGDGDGLHEDLSELDVEIVGADALTLLATLTGIDPMQCPCCHVGRLTARPIPRARPP